MLKGRSQTESGCGQPSGTTAGLPTAGVALPAPDRCPPGCAGGGRRPSLASHVLALLLVLAALSAGCGMTLGPRLTLDRSRLPGSVPELVEMSDRGVDRSRSVRVIALSTAAIEKAMDLRPDDPDLLWRAARGYTLLAENVTADPTVALHMAEHATELAHRAMELAPERPEGYYYAAAAAGLVAMHQLAPGRVVQEAVEKPARELVELDPAYQEGGGLRILGALLVKAPSWPAGVGDVDEGVELLERAVAEHPSHPLNHLFLAQAYAKVGRRVDALSAVRFVLTAPPTGEWRLVGGPYRQEARQLLADLRANR